MLHFHMSDLPRSPVGSILKHSLRFTSSVKRWGLGRFAVSLSQWVHFLPHAAVSRLGSILGDGFYYGSPRYRSVALSNLRWAFKNEWPEDKIMRIARVAFRNIGKSAVEFLQFPTLTDADILRMTSYENEERIDAALKRGKGCIFVGAHFGNWELMTARLALDGYKVSIIVREADDAGTNRVIHRLRESRGYHAFSRKGSMKPVLQALRRNECLGILIDQNYTSGVFVPFFGKLAATATGAAALARATGAAVIPVFSIRQPDETHRIVLKPELDLTFTEDKDADLHRITALLTATVEAAVREHPEQWFWIHNRWKKRPSDEAA
jgi:KDO2-lipid IV(A) lauroyltransferase